jgi:cyclophilin family peptidyl-prolyl cis-trans isomerase
MVRKEWLAVTGLVLAVSCLVFSGCGKGNTPAASIEGTPTASDSPIAQSAKPEPLDITTAPPPPVQKKPQVDPIVIIQTSHGNLRVQLFVHKAPQTVDNFLRNYVNRGFYEQTIFHHVDKNSMIAGGGFTSDLQAKPNRAPVYNESTNGLKNTRGTIAMARDPELAHSATSQFFFNLVDNGGFDYAGEGDTGEFGYCVFGQVIEGLDVLDKIAQLPVAPQGDFPSVPTEPVVIQGIQQVQ